MASLPTCHANASVTLDITHDFETIDAISKVAMMSGLCQVDAGMFRGSNCTANVTGEAKFQMQPRQDDVTDSKTWGSKHVCVEYGLCCKC